MSKPVFDINTTTEQIVLKLQSKMVRVKMVRVVDWGEGDVEVKPAIFLSDGFEIEVWSQSFMKLYWFDPDTDERNLITEGNFDKVLDVYAHC